MNAEYFYLHLFDLVAATMVGFGLFRGRRRGMSEELLDLLKWLLIVFLGGLLYKPLGNLYIQVANLGAGYAYVLAYLTFAIGLGLLFAYLKQNFGEKVVGADVFGESEFRLGLVAGGLRYACILVVFMALLNSYYITPAELKAQARWQRENFGSISFPTFGTIQENVMKDSYTGNFARKYLNDQLIMPVSGGTMKTQTPAERRERAVEEIIQGM